MTSGAGVLAMFILKTVKFGLLFGYVERLALASTLLMSQHERNVDGLT